MDIIMVFFGIFIVAIIIFFVLMIKGDKMADKKLDEDLETLEENMKNWNSMVEEANKE